MKKRVLNVCKTFCGITCTFEADKKWIKISKVSKILIFKKCSNSLSLQKAFFKRSYYQIVSIVKKNWNGLMCYAKSCYSETSTLVDFTWEIVVANEKGKFSLQRHKGFIPSETEIVLPTDMCFSIFHLLRKPLIFLKIPPLMAENWWFYYITVHNFGAPLIFNASW